MSDASDASDEWVCTYDATHAWIKQRKEGGGYHHGAFMRAARKAGVRELMGVNQWDGYYWNVGDLNRLMKISVAAIKRSADTIQPTSKTTL